MKKTINGYLYFYDPQNPYANKSGIVYEHIKIMCEHIGRHLKDNECVHHRDRNKLNNSLDNLMLLTKSEHVSLHLLEDKGYYSEIRVCKYCGKEFKCPHKSNQKYCSDKCARNDQRKFDISKEELEKLVWEMPSTKVAKIFGVSDRAIGKRCKLLGIQKPPRGYWSNK